MDIKTKTINSMRGIALDAINKVGQGHIGMAIGAAPLTYSLIGQELKISSHDPKWINRDRFVLSAGHGSMSMYSIMHFLGLLSIEDMKSHKMMGSRTPSHPEIDAFDYVDATTGPLGQGVAMAVGMAISEKYLQNKFNKPDNKLIDHNIYALHGDGCVQEGVALEAIQLAGTLKLDNLILIHDFNEVQIDSTSTDVNNIDFVKYFESQNFAVFCVDDPSPENIDEAIQKAKKSNKPSYIKVKTLIAHGTKIQGKVGSHNGILSPEDTIEFKKNLNLTALDEFKYDQDVYDNGKSLMAKKDKEYDSWKEQEKAYLAKYPQDHKLLMDIYHEKTKNNVMDIEFQESGVATRNYIVPLMERLETFDNILGGSADLAAATKVKFSKDFQVGGKNLKYGIREFSMVAINNGIYLHSKIKTIDATFLTFADYAKGAYRLGAIQEIPGIHVLTHDSYQVGGDGPTHQPLDQLPMLRAISGMKVIRSADEYEMRAAFQAGLDSKKISTAIIACRQPIRSYKKLIGKIVPAYPVVENEKFDLNILASGSEVTLAHDVADKLKTLNINARVLSVPILQDLIEDVSLIKKLKLDQKPMYFIEASSEYMWYKLAKYNKIDGHTSKGYGYSAPGDEVYAKKGFTVENITKKIQEFLK